MLFLKDHALVTGNNLEQSIFEGNVSKLAHSPQTTKHSIHFIIKSTLAKRKSRSQFLFVSIYITVNRNRFSPFWIYRQRYELNVVPIQLSKHSILCKLKHFLHGLW